MNGAPSEAAVATKASILVGLVEALERAGLRARVRDRLSPTVRRALDAPPPATQWIDLAVLEELFTVIEEVAGRDAMCDLAYEGARGMAVKILLPMVQGMLRLFGATPHTLLSRFDLLMRNATRGMRFEYARVGPQAATIEIHVAARPLAPAYYRAWAGSLRTLFELCSTRGTIADAELLDGGRGARYRVDW